MRLSSTLPQVVHSRTLKIKLAQLPLSAILAASLAHADPALVSLYNYATSTGSQPLAGVAIDSAGNLFGTTSEGGTFGDGNVYEVSGPNYSNYTTLFAFNGSNGANPYSSVTIGPDGNLYGTTYRGGTSQIGTVFELSGPGYQTLTTLVNFNRSNGAFPAGGLTFDNAGNMYGTTIQGGTNSVGTIFELSGSGYGTMSTLASFNTSSGHGSNSKLTVDASGNLFGTAFTGGTTSGIGTPAGTIFELSGANHGIFTTLTQFLMNVTPNVYNPYASPVFDTAGNLYGETYGGSGSGGGVFELSGPDHQTFTLLTPTNQLISGCTSLAVDADGDIFGGMLESPFVPFSNRGTVFELSGANHQNFTNLATLGVNAYSGYVAITPDSKGNLFIVDDGSGYLGTLYELSGSGFAVPVTSAMTACSFVAMAALGLRRRGAAGGTENIRVNHWSRKSCCGDSAEGR